MTSLRPRTFLDRHPFLRDFIAAFVPLLFVWIVITCCVWGAYSIADMQGFGLRGCVASAVGGLLAGNALVAAAAVVLLPPEDREVLR